MAAPDARRTLSPAGLPPALELSGAVEQDGYRAVPVPRGQRAERSVLVIDVDRLARSAEGDDLMGSPR